MQRVAKLMAVKADYEVMRELAKLEAADQAGQDWDERYGPFLTNATPPQNTRTRYDGIFSARNCGNCRG